MSPLVPNPEGVVVCTAQKLQIAADRARQHHKERGHRSGSGGFSEYLGGFYKIDTTAMRTAIPRILHDDTTN